MRLSDVLSRPPGGPGFQVEAFLGSRKLACGTHKKLTVGRIALNFFCKICQDDRTYVSGDDLYCIVATEHMISVDSVLKCLLCGSSVQAWFLIGCDDLFTQAPRVRIVKRTDYLSSAASTIQERDEDFTEMLEKARRAHNEELGAGAIVYLRKIFERITEQAAEAAGITTKTPRGRPKPFKQVLQEVDERCSIIPREFSNDGYKLFGELSGVVHGHSSEEEALAKYHSLRRLVIGIVENVKNNKEMMSAIGSLGWSDDEELHSDGRGAPIEQD